MRRQRPSDAWEPWLPWAVGMRVEAREPTHGRGRGRRLGTTTVQRLTPVQVVTAGGARWSRGTAELWGAAGGPYIAPINTGHTAEEG